MRAVLQCAVLESWLHVNRTCSWQKVTILISTTTTAAAAAASSIRQERFRL